MKKPLPAQRTSGQCSSSRERGWLGKRTGDYATVAQIWRNIRVCDHGLKLCLGKMSDRKSPHFLRHCRCVHHCWWQKAAISGKFPATKGVILRQVHCRLLSLFAAPVLPWIFPKARA
jgi:hypothetical protein